MIGKSAIGDVVSIGLAREVDAALRKVGRHDGPEILILRPHELTSWLKAGT